MSVSYFLQEPGLSQCVAAATRQRIEEGRQLRCNCILQLHDSLSLSMLSLREEN
jgi:hypothetical protein